MCAGRTRSARRLAGWAWVATVAVDEVKERFRLRRWWSRRVTFSFIGTGLDRIHVALSLQTYATAVYGAVQCAELTLSMHLQPIS